MFNIYKKQLTEQEKFKIINSKHVNQEVVSYIKDKLSNLTINICGEYEDNLIELMNKGLLQGWCWQTTETAIVFFNDNDYIERGYLKLDKYKNYYHSWICFKYKKKEYVFDPCLNLLCKKNIYNKIFDINVISKIYSKDVKKELIDFLEKNKTYLERYFEKILIKRREMNVIEGNEDVNSTMYRNNTGYCGVIHDNKIKKLVAHYYLKG